MIFTLEVLALVLFLLFLGVYNYRGEKEFGSAGFYQSTDRLVIRRIQSITVAGGA